MLQGQIDLSLKKSEDMNRSEEEALCDSDGGHRLGCGVKRSSAMSCYGRGIDFVGNEVCI